MMLLRSSRDREGRGVSITARATVPLSGLLMMFALMSSAMGQSEKGMRGDELFAEYFRAETKRLGDACLADIHTLDEWMSRRDAYRHQLLDMLGLNPLPNRTDLNARVTSTKEGPGFRVEQVHFQSRPGLYVTGNLYIPANSPQSLPAVLYVCGHASVKRDGVSYGNKAHYQRHGAWFARNGYVCLIIDSLQLGEIEAIHHGLYRYGMWWWLNRGYTPSGVEAWNCVRALDYLQTRPEVDGERLGVTGRSGGGINSWWIAAIDERIRAAVPVAGITDLQNHVVDGCVEGHCDCMYFVNTFGWDYPLVAALIAPRPLLISNSDRDSIYPLDGVVRTHEKVRRIYRLYGAEEQLALQITAGRHQDTQELRVHAFRWLNRHLKETEDLIDTVATTYFEPRQLQVLRERPLPEDERNTTIHESFVPLADIPPSPTNAAEWDVQCDQWRQQLMRLTFAGWPDASVSLNPNIIVHGVRDGVRFSTLEFDSQHPFRLGLLMLIKDDLQTPKGVDVHVVDQETWNTFATEFDDRAGENQTIQTTAPVDSGGPSWRQRALSTDRAIAILPPRGVGPTQWNPSRRKQIQNRRRLYLLGQTLEGMQVWDVRRAVQSLGASSEFRDVPVRLLGRGSMAGVALYAAMFESRVESLDLHDVPASHREGPFFLNVRRVMDLPQAVAVVANRVPVRMTQTNSFPDEYARAVLRQTKRPDDQLVIQSADTNR